MAVGVARVQVLVAVVVQTIHCNVERDTAIHGCICTEDTDMNGSISE